MHLFILFLFLLQPAWASGGGVNSAEEKIPLDSKVVTGKLSNGITYFILENKKPEKRAEFRLAVNIGSLAEDDDQQGLAHFVEHMAFNGTKNFAKNELIDYLESVGVKFGPHLNAYTSFDETVYMLQLPTDSEEIVNKGLQVLEDWAHNLTFDSLEIEKERGVVIEEWRSRLGGETRMLYEYLPVLYKDSRYAERLPIGRKEILEKFNHQDLKRFYYDWYRPELMAVIAVGDFDVAAMEKKIREQFNNIPASKSKKERAYYPIPDHKEVLAKVATDREATFTQVRISYKNDKQYYLTVNDYKTMLMQRLYNSMMSERLEELKARPDPPFSSAWSSVSGMTRTKDAYTSGAMVGETGVERGIENLLRETGRVEQHGFTQSELERNKKKLLRQMEKTYEERDKTESRSLTNNLIAFFLRKSPMPGTEWEYEMYQKLLPGITIEEVNAITGKWIKDENVVIIVTAPAKESVVIPNEEKLVSIFRKMNETQQEPYKEEAIAETLMQAPQGGSIASERKLAEAGATEIILANGAKVILKSTDFKNDEILFTAFSFGGSSLYNDADYYSADVAGQAVYQAGIGGFTKVQLDKALAGKVVSFSPYVGDESEGMSGSASKKDIETLFQLINLTFTQPRKDADAFQSYLQKQMMRYENLKSNPDYYFFNRVGEILSQEHPRSTWLWSKDDFEKVDFEKTNVIFRERFSNPADFTFFFVGSFEIESMKLLIEKYLGSLAAKPDKENWKDTGMRYVKGKIDEKIYKGVEPKCRVSLNYTGEYEYAPENNFKLGSMVELMRITLREQMREEQGGVYGVSADAGMGKYPNADYKVEIEFSCDPEKADSLISIALAEVEKIKKGEIEDDDIRKVKEKARRQHEIDLKENRYWLNALNSIYYNNLNLSDALNKPEMIDRLSKDDITAVARRYLSSNFARIVMYPEEGR